LEKPGKKKRTCKRRRKRRRKIPVPTPMTFRPQIKKILTLMNGKGKAMATISPISWIFFSKNKVNFLKRT
jgi:hypothetical protein